MIWEQECFFPSFKNFNIVDVKFLYKRGYHKNVLLAIIFDFVCSFTSIIRTFNPINIIYKKL